MNFISIIIVQYNFSYNLVFSIVKRIFNNSNLPFFIVGKDRAQGREMIAALVLNSALTADVSGPFLAVGLFRDRTHNRQRVVR